MDDGEDCSRLAPEIAWRCSDVGKVLALGRQRVQARLRIAIAQIARRWECSLSP